MAHRRAAVRRAPPTVLALVLAVCCSLPAAVLTGPGQAGATPATTGTVSRGHTGSTTTTAPSAQSAITAAEAQVSRLESQISQEQAALDRADEAYDRAQVVLSQTQASLAATQAAARSTAATLARERRQLRHDVVQAYVDDTSASTVAALFAAPSSTSQTRSLYQRIGADNVADVVARVQGDERTLSRTRAKLLAEQRSETAQLASQTRAREAAAATSQQSEATLAQVKGNLAAQVARQAAAQAAAAARQAADAQGTAAARNAAEQAADAAQVASALGGGSAAAVGATNAANQAAGSAAGGSGVTLASGGSPQAAGLAAVHGAMQYLGVPYAWGGASRAGVDCSGLTMLAWANAGVSLPHSAALQYSESAKVSLGALEPGDLLFYDLDGTGIDHVVMYVGPVLDGHATAYGAGTIIQAAHTGTVVTFDPYWTEGLVGAARP